MEEKLKKIYDECIKELKSIGINIENNKEIGNIDIKISSRATKRYGCCKQENPDKTYFDKIKIGRRRYIKYNIFKMHHIEISKWVMDLDDKIIKNTIMHEIIHCFPYCNDHGKKFKEYANYINIKLGYNISRVGDKKADYEKSNLEYNEEEEDYKYKIICKNCGQIYYRKRIPKNLTEKYRCSKCNGKLDFIFIT